MPQECHRPREEGRAALVSCFVLRHLTFFRPWSVAAPWPLAAQIKQRVPQEAMKHDSSDR